MVRIALLAWLLSGFAAYAQVALGQFHVFDTRFGQMQVVGSEVDHVLKFRSDDTFVDIFEGYQIDIRTAFARGDEAHDWVLVSVHANPGAACPWQYVLLRVAADRVTFSPGFAACLGVPIDVRLDAGRIVLEFLEPGRVAQRVAFAFDGARLTSVLQ